MTTYGYFAAAIAFGLLAILAQWREDQSKRTIVSMPAEPTAINWWTVTKAFAALVAFVALVAAVSSHVVSTSDY